MTDDLATAPLDANDYVKSLPLLCASSGKTVTYTLQLFLFTR